MASWQAHVTVWMLKWRFKRKIRGETNIQKARETMSAIKHKVPPGVNAIDEPVGGVPGEWMEPELGKPAGTLLYLHGGGYIACSPQTHRPITGGFARRGFEVFAPDYRLAPEHPFPAAIEDAVRAYRGLLAKDIAPERIVIGGDSAGGGLALATLLSLRDAGETMPAGAVLFSPWTDLAGTGETLKTNTDRDAMFYGDGVTAATGPYLNGADPHDPLASPLYADLSGLPPMIIHAGTYEVLLDDSRRLAERARAVGVEVVLQTWPVVPHVWQLFRMPEATQSLDAAATFLKARLQGATERLAA
jgi:acetyl esterase/lipase